VRPERLWSWTRRVLDDTLLAAPLRSFLIALGQHKGHPPPNGVREARDSAALGRSDETENVGAVMGVLLRVANYELSAAVVWGPSLCEIHWYHFEI
jgi:hypothetical protein